MIGRAETPSKHTAAHPRASPSPASSPASRCRGRARERQGISNSAKSLNPQNLEIRKISEFASTEVRFLRNSRVDFLEIFDFPKIDTCRSQNAPTASRRAETRARAPPRVRNRLTSVPPPQIRDGPRVVSCGLSTSCRVDVSPDVIALPGLLCAGEEGRAASCGEASGIVLRLCIRLLMSCFFELTSRHVHRLLNCTQRRGAHMPLRGWI